MPPALPIPADLLDLRRVRDDAWAELNAYVAEVEALRREQYPDPDQTDVRASWEPEQRERLADLVVSCRAECGRDRDVLGSLNVRCTPLWRTLIPSCGRRAQPPGRRPQDGAASAPGGPADARARWAAAGAAPQAPGMFTGSNLAPGPGAG